MGGTPAPACSMHHSLLRCKLRIAVYNVLEFIHHCSIRNKVDGILKVHLAVIIASFPEEKLDPWFRKEFHGHGMDFCCLHGQIPGVIGDRILAGYITLKCMSTLMCDYIHVTTGSVKVCKNKRYTIIRKLRHVTTGSLILTAEYIKSSFSIIMLKKSLVSSDISVYILRPLSRISSGVPIGAGSPCGK